MPLIVLCALYVFWSQNQSPPESGLDRTTQEDRDTKPVLRQKTVEVDPVPPEATPSKDIHLPSKPYAKEIRPVGPQIPIKTESQSTKSGNPYLLPTDSIPFRIEGNWAIAYGDVLLGTVTAPKGVTTGNHRPEKPRLWDSAIIPYGIHADLQGKERVEAAIRYFNENTVVRFVPIEGPEEDAVVFVPDERNCASYIGRIGGMQPIMVADKCGTQELIHELMHALGFVHEHSRVDRDRYLEVVWDNIQADYWPQFAMVPDILIHEYRGRVFDFDASSAMLYPPTAFAKEKGLTTLKSKPGSQLNPATEGLSKVDRERLFYLYGS